LIFADWPDISDSYDDEGCGFGGVYLCGIYKAINFTSEFIYVRSFLSIQENFGRFKTGMTDWGLAIKIACGGFGLVFIILVILGISAWLTKVITERIAKDKS
jgi:hypothetical protein